MKWNSRGIGLYFGRPRRFSSINLTVAQHTRMWHLHLSAIPVQPLFLLARIKISHCPLPSNFQVLRHPCDDEIVFRVRVSES